MLVARNMRLVAADFSADEPLLMVFARGARAEQLRTLVKQGSLENDEPAVAGESAEVAKRDREAIEMAAKSALRLLHKQGKQILLLDFADEAEPMLTVYARGARAGSLSKALAATGLVHRATTASLA